jgi:hypothetical protein
MDGSTGFGDDNVIQNNWMGLDAEGNVLGNAQHGMMMSSNADHNLIGGTGANKGNVVGGTPSGYAGITVQQTRINNTITYSMDDDAGGRFAIDSSSGVVTLVGGLDFATAASHHVTVLGGLSCCGRSAAGRSSRRSPAACRRGG